ncbi:MAG: DUF2262 domain-containing protein [Oscillospiraceae bacterium]|nr:DUF2262 domain-containing protein [Oscillospiraceae bacterium]
MNANDFKDGGEYEAYRAVCEIQGRDVIVHVYYEGGLSRENCPLETIMPKIEESVKMISDRGKLAKALKRDGIIDRAEEWVYESEPVDDDEDCFIIDGVEVRLPISVETFAESLRVNGLGITFDGSADNFFAEVFLYCSPDYFAGHSIEVRINSDGSMECLGLAG